MKYTRENPYKALLKDRYLLNKQGSTKKTYHLSLKIDSKKLLYKPGDSVGIIPLNHEGLIKKTIQALELLNLNQSEIKFLHLVNLCKGTKKLLQYINQNLKNINHNSEIENLISDKLALKEFLSSYQVWEILQKYPANLQLNNFCDTLQPMLPRFYSIASSNNFIKDEIHLLVAENTYFLKDQLCHGVGSNYLCNTLKVNEHVAIYVQENHRFVLPKEEKTPIIMIGPGTGIAPFRAFLQERSNTKTFTQNWLFFGERNRCYDYYYQDYLENLYLSSKLKLNLAFSRDQSNKVYVQDLIQQNGKDFFDWIERGAIVYVCGDAKQMAKSVEKAILQVFQTHGKMSENESYSYLKTLRKAKRYLCDVY